MFVVIYFDGHRLEWGICLGGGGGYMLSLLASLPLYSTSAPAHGSIEDGNGHHRLVEHLQHLVADTEASEPPQNDQPVFCQYMLPTDKCFLPHFNR